MFSNSRFSSLVLGSENVIPADQCNLSFRMGGGQGPAGQQHLFMAQLGILAGKVIDLTRAGLRESYDKVLALDHEINQCTLQLTAHDWIAEHWLETPQDNAEMKSLTLHLGGYVMFYTMKTFLHMPYMFRAANNPGYNFSRETCFEAARGVVRCVYLVRRGSSEHKFRGFDFLGFVGCVTLLLSLLGYGGFENESESMKDWNLIERTLELFQSVSDGPFDKVASQCYSALLKLSEFGQQSAQQPLMARDNLQVVVPFFGMITIRSGRLHESPVQRAVSGSHPGTEPVTVDLGHLANPTVPQSVGSVQIAYDGPHIHSEISNIPIQASHEATTMDLQFDDFLQVR
jgi:hypothetical protein